MKRWIRGGWAVLALGASLITSAAELRIAAASNLQFVLPKLVAEFSAENTEIKIATSYAASGSLVAQINHGAPFDLFLSADLEYPEALITSGQAVGPKPQIFAHGVLVLWPHPGDAHWQERLKAADTKRVALAHHETAPYGRAAHALLKSEGLWNALAAKIVLGENVAQTLHFVHSGNADFGFVAASLLVADQRLDPGLELANETIALPHGAVRLKNARQPRTGQAFLDWLRTNAARQILVENGYRLP
ncbi:MAG: molybdate ABC transporter substrate-binding protein [Synoicihabitans sp.]